MIEDGTTNRAFLLALLDRPEFRSGEVDINWLDRLGVSGEMEAPADADAALLQAAIELADEETATERAAFYAYARRGRPQSEAEVSRAVEVRHRGQAYRIVVSQLAPARYRCQVDGARRRGRGGAPQPARAPHHHRRAHAPHADLPPGHRPARRGPRRAAPHRPRRRAASCAATRPRSSWRSRSPRATRWPRATSWRSSSR